ncbi:MAG: glycosyltransferase family 39 protein [Bacteroidales bacterium]
MFKNFKPCIYSILLIILVIAFIIIKIPYLSLPYYWDEAWVYGPALRIMESHKLSLLPDALPVYYSRGHPLFFHFMGALWLRMFGTSLVASHIYALFISIALLISVYIFCKQLFSKEVGIIACLFLMLQPVFQAQSVLVLPEVMLSLFSLLTIFFFTRGNWLGYIISATLALYTKETGIVVIASVGLWFLIETLMLKRKEFQFKQFLLRSATLLTPLVLIAIYFILQKQTNGWYFFPEHINYLTHDSRTFSDKLNGYAAYLFIYWGRNVLSSAIIVSLFLYFYFKKHRNNPANKPLLILAIYNLLFLIASSFNFYSDRYSMSMMAPFMIITAYLVFSTFSKKIFLFAFIASVVIVQIFIFLPKKTNSDHNLGYVEPVKTHRQMVNYCIENNFQKKKIFTHFLMLGNLKNPYCGYLSEDQKFTNVSSTFDKTTELCIFSNMEGADEYKQIKKSANLKLLKRFESKQAWSEIYEVVKKGYSSGCLKISDIP